MQTPMKAKPCTTLLFAIIAQIITTPVPADLVPGILNYQGRVKVNGANFNGTGQFKFVLINADGSETFWSHDGTSVAGSEPTGRPLEIPVVRGVFGIPLGDTTVPHMTEAVAEWIFESSKVLVRVWFSDGSHGFQRLIPDERITSVGYALVAERAHYATGVSFLTAPGGGQPRVFVHPSGTVGIGSLLPRDLLHVAPKTASDGIFLGVDPTPSGYGYTGLKLGLTALTGGAAEIQAIKNAGAEFGDLLLNSKGGRVSVGLLTTSGRPGKLLQLGDEEALNSEGMIRLASRSGTGGARRFWDIGVPETDQDVSGPGYSFVIDDPRNGTQPEFIIRHDTGNVGIGTTHPQSKLHVNGEVRATVLRLSGGADIAEPFSVRENKELQPGMVLCIDPERTGALRLSSRAYDTTVAGIVSGSGGISPGLTLQQTGSVANGDHLVALTGRVWCRVDADAGGGVRPGDLLTSSDTLGHAMRVNDTERSHGAVLGKAMSPLASGKGLVLVLVSLQ